MRDIYGLAESVQTLIKDNKTKEETSQQLYNDQPPFIQQTKPSRNNFPKTCEEDDFKLVTIDEESQTQVNKVKVRGSLDWARQ